MAWPNFAPDRWTSSRLKTWCLSGESVTSGRLGGRSSAIPTSPNQRRLLTSTNASPGVGRARFRFMCKRLRWQSSPPARHWVDCRDRPTMSGLPQDALPPREVSHGSRSGHFGMLTAPPGKNAGRDLGVLSRDGIRRLDSARHRDADSPSRPTPHEGQRSQAHIHSSDAARGHIRRLEQ